MLLIGDYYFNLLVHFLPDLLLKPYYILHSIQLALLSFNIISIPLLGIFCKKDKPSFSQQAHCCSTLILSGGRDNITRSHQPLAPSCSWL